MDIGSLPTDNVYQFMVFAGLLLVVLSVLGPWRQSERMIREVFELRRDQSSAELN